MESEDGRRMGVVCTREKEIRRGLDKKKGENRANGMQPLQSFFLCGDFHLKICMVIWMIMSKYKYEF
jgi:hypothetical protein